MSEVRMIIRTVQTLEIGLTTSVVEDCTHQALSVRAWVLMEDEGMQASSILWWF